MKVLLMLVVLIMLSGCMLDETYDNNGLWISNCFNINFISNNTLILNNKIDKTLSTHEYYMDNGYIYLKTEYSYTQHFRLYKWSKDELIIRNNKSGLNFLLIKE